MNLSLKSLLTQKLKGAERVVVLGVGSELRGDDVAGPLVLEELQKKKHPKLQLIDGGTAPENFTGEIKKKQPTHLVIVDAADLGSTPGTIRLIELGEIRGMSFSTHALPLKVMIDFILQDHQCEVVVAAIQPKSLKFGAQPCAEVKDAAAILAHALLSAL